MCPASNNVYECQYSKFCGLRQRTKAGGSYPLEAIGLISIKYRPEVREVAESSACFKEVDAMLAGDSMDWRDLELALDARPLAEKIRLRRDSIEAEARQNRG